MEALGPTVARGGSRWSRLTQSAIKPVAALIDRPSWANKSVDEPLRVSARHTPWERHITPIGIDAVLPYELDKQAGVYIARFDNLRQNLKLFMCIETHVPRVHSVTSRGRDKEKRKKANMYYKEIGPSLRYEKGNECRAGETKVRQSERRATAN